MSLPNHKRNKDGRYGPTTRSHYYQPVGYHGRGATNSSQKTRWALKEGQQFEVFRVCDEPWWHSGGGLFSIMNGGSVVLGENGERLGRFPDPQNQADPWHGYPVFSADYLPDESLLDQWVATQVIPDHVRTKIERGRL
jgi:hypothetical protein